MLKNYLKIALRQLLRNKVFSFINIVGLSIGMATFILLALWIKSELTYNDSFSKKERIYSLWNKSYWGSDLTCWDVTPRVAASALREHYPEIELVTRVDWMQTRWLKVGSKMFLGAGNAVDPEFLKIFDVEVMKGNKAGQLSTPKSILLTKKLAEKIYGNEEALGKVIELEDGSKLAVSGIINDPPANSTYSYEYLLPWKLIEGEKPETNWGNNSTKTLLLLKENVSLEKFQAKIKNLRKDYGQTDDVYDMFIYPMKRWRLYSKFENGIEAGGKIELLRYFIVVAILILIIACINFTNLSTARGEKRAREVGVRKTLGARRKILVSQFISETIILAAIAFIIALGLVHLCLPAYNKLVLKDLSLDYSNGYFWLFSLLFILLSGFLAGTYPAFYLSSFNPVRVLKGTFQPVKAILTPRKILVVSQFVFAIVLIIATLVIKKQISHVLQRDVGYNQDKLVYHFMNEPIDRNYQLIKTDLLSKNLAEAVNKTSSPITQGWSDSWGFNWEGKDPNDKTDFDRYYVDENFTGTIGVKLLKGRDFDLKKFPTDSSAMIINESALKVMKFKNPIGQIINDGDQPYHVIGVMKDFILHSPFNSTKPMLAMGAKGWFNVINLKLKDYKNLAEIEKVFKKYNPAFPFDIKHVDKEHESKLDDMKKSGILASLFAGLTIIISCLGLFGLATFMAESKIKEIGIRKVLGASVSNITLMLSVNFIKLVAIAFIVAAPIAWWLMSKWLQDFDYKANIGWGIFVMAGLTSVLVSVTTVFFQSIRAALSNPIKSLRTE